MMNKDTLKNFYAYMENQKYPIDATFIFVYNDYNTYNNNDPHIEECFDNEEAHEIVDSVGDIFAETLTFSSEKLFVEWCTTRKPSAQRIYVYTMAQYINGFGRRTLIPALCQYYGFINLNADVYMSAIGCNKKTMFQLLIANNMESILAPTIFLDSFNEINMDMIYSQLGNQIILKPINESCCIDTIVLRDYTKNELASSAIQLINKYGYAMVQTYISGKEIGVTVVCHNSDLFTLAPMQVIFSAGKTYLTHIDSYYENYQLKNYTISPEVLESCKNISKILGFYCIARYDFRYDGKNYYLFDLSPNPTINGYTSSNLAARETLQCDHRGIIRLMAYEKIALFEPPFNSSH